MKTFAALFLMLATTSAHAANLECTSVGQNLPANRLEISVKLERSWLGTVTGGSYSYTNPITAESNSGEFACAKANDKGTIFCGPLRQDKNIQTIVIHRVMGLMFQLTDQQHVALFDCK